ncbi:MAG: hypothetical protein WC523_00470 [Patescibacteria group bacterium]
MSLYGQYQVCEKEYVDESTINRLPKSCYRYFFGKKFTKYAGFGANNDTLNTVLKYAIGNKTKKACYESLRDNLSYHQSSKIVNEIIGMAIFLHASYEYLKLTFKIKQLDK